MQISGAGLDQRVATSTELSTVDSRQRIDSLSKQPQARPPSIFDDTEKYDFSRAESIGSRGARPASIIEEQEVSFHYSYTLYIALFIWHIFILLIEQPTKSLSFNCCWY